jgi:hypothetical protein
VRRLTALFLALGLVWLAAACGGSDGGEATGADDGRRGIPSVEVTDLATGGPVDLASVADPERPTLVWFWAPF